MRGRVSTWTSPCGWGGGGSEGGGGGNRSCPRKNGGRRSPPEKGVKMFELAQLKLKKGGGAATGDSSPCASTRWDWGGLEFAGRTRTWTPPWWALMEMGGFDPAAANRGAYAGLVHGIASRPKSKPKPAANPATGGPPQPHPPNPWDASAKALRPSPPPWAGKAQCVDCVLALI